MPDAPVTLVHATDRYAVIDKAGGFLSVPGRGPDKRDCAAARVAAMFPSATGPLVVHRLDMDTSGLMVFALDPGAQRDLSRQFEDRRVEKAYVAVVEGEMPADRGVIDAPMRLDLDHRPVQVIDFERGRAARTEWRVIDAAGGRARVELTPQTGRTHQLRLHLAHLGHPIVGDVLYGAGRASGERLMLHATALGFRELDRDEMARFRSPAPF